MTRPGSSPTSDALLVGVAGWDYPDWVGPVYPAGAGRHIDRLAFIARYVDVVEINSSFYRPVAPRIAESWLRRTEGRSGFFFTAKAHRSWSHERSPTPDLSGLAGLAPLRESGRLRGLLVQFPQSFRDSPASRSHLLRVAEWAQDWPLVVELRHSGWITEPTLEWLRRLGAGWCVVDQPDVGATARAEPRVLGDPAYLRLHGRNSANWFRAEAGRDARYDYCYSLRELGELAGTARKLARDASELVVVQNNHFRGQALVNALQMKALLGRARPAAPGSLVDAYPELANQVRIERNRLF